MERLKPFCIHQPRMLDLNKQRPHPSIAFSLHASGAWGNCDNTIQLTGAALESTVNGRTVCATGANGSWQEEHRSDGVLRDYKKGPGDPVDPQKQVGTWQLVDEDGDGENDHIQYTYIDNNGVPTVSYTFSIHEDNGQYTFCNGTNAVVTGARFQDSPNCGFSSP